MSLNPEHAVSAPAPDDEHAPDPAFGTCRTCAQPRRLTVDGVVHQHWRRDWPRRLGNPPCPGSGQAPTDNDPFRNAWWNKKKEGSDA